MPTAPFLSPAPADAPFARRWWVALRRFWLVQGVARLSRDGLHDRAAARAQKWLAKQVGNARLHELLGCALFAQQQAEAATEHLHTATQLAPANARICARYLLVARRTSKAEEARAHGTAWVQQHRLDRPVVQQLALLLGDVDRNAEAAALTRRALRLRLGYSAFRANACHYIGREEGAAAVHQFVGWHRFYLRGNTPFQRELARALHEAGDLVEAERIYRRVHRKHPAASVYFEELVRVWIDQGKHAKIDEAVRGWQKKHPTGIGLFTQIGRHYFRQENYHEAGRAFREAYDRDPETVLHFNNLILALSWAEDWAPCLDLCPKHAPALTGKSRALAHNAWGLALSARGQHDEATPRYAEATTADPTDEVIFANGLRNLLRRDRTREAIARARERLGAELPFGPDCWGEYYRAVKSAGPPEEALAVAEQWLTAAPPLPEAMTAVAHAQHELGHDDLARARFEAWLAEAPNETERWVALGNFHFDHGDHAAREALSTRALVALPHDPVIAELRMLALRSLDRADDALRFGQEWIATTTTPVPGHVFNTLGLAADDVADWTAAIKYYGEAHRTERANPIWLGNLARAHILAGKPTLAIPMATAWMEANSRHPYVLGKLAWAHRASDDSASEGPLLRELHDAHPTDPDHSMALLENLCRAGRDESAATFLAELESQDLATSGIFNNWANHLREKGRLDDAAETYEKALRAQPNNDTAAANLMSLLRQQRRASEAITLARPWLAKFPNGLLVRRQLVDALLETESYGEAQTEAQHLLLVAPLQTFAAGRFVATLRLQGQLAASLTWAECWLSCQSGDPYFHIERGFAAEGLQRWAEAATHYDAALELAPDSPTAAYSKLCVVGHHLELETAIKFGESWANQYEAEPRFWNRLAILHDRAGRLSEARDAFARAHAAAPDDAAYAGNLIEIETRRGNPETAIELTRAYGQNTPPDPFVLRQAARAHAATHDAPTALATLETAHLLEPHDDDIAIDYARIAIESDDYQDGIQFLEKHLAETPTPDNPLVHSWLEQLYFLAGNTADAIRVGERACQLAPETLSYRQQLLNTMHRLGENARVLAAYRELPEPWQQDGGILLTLSQTYDDIGVPAEALHNARLASAASPELGEAMAWLIKLTARDDSPEVAAALADQTLAQQAKSPNAEVLVARAQLHLDAEAYGAALAVVERVLDRHPAHGEALALKVRAMHALGQARAARTELYRWIEHHRPTPGVRQILRELEDEE